MGESTVDASRLTEFVRTYNPDFSDEIAEAFINVGKIYGVRGDIAFCQAILETGWFKFSGGTAVEPEQYNYCGLGVLSLGDKGHSFNSVVEGVTAHIQHLFAYACRNSLPADEQIIDPRFKLVSRGCASSWEQLSGRWAMNPNYGHNILRLYRKIAGNPAPPRIEDPEPDYFIPEE